MSDSSVSFSPGDSGNNAPTPRVNINDALQGNSSYQSVAGSTAPVSTPTSQSPVFSPASSSAPVEATALKSQRSWMPVVLVVGVIMIALGIGFYVMTQNQRSFTPENSKTISDMESIPSDEIQPITDPNAQDIYIAIGLSDAFKGKVPLKNIGETVWSYDPDFDQTSVGVYVRKDALVVPDESHLVAWVGNADGYFEYSILEPIVSAGGDYYALVVGSGKPETFTIVSITTVPIDGFNPGSFPSGHSISTVSLEGSFQ